MSDEQHDVTTDSPWSTGVAYRYEDVWVYDTTMNERRHWWQFWRKRQRVRWSGPVALD